jgi:hypothetical protein
MFDWLRPVLLSTTLALVSACGSSSDPPDGGNIHTRTDAEVDLGPDGRDVTQVEQVTVEGAPSFCANSVRLRQAILTRNSANTFEVAAWIALASESCRRDFANDACGTRVELALSMEQTRDVEAALTLALASLYCPPLAAGEHMPSCDMCRVYALGVEGPAQDTTCCRANRYATNMDVANLHHTLETWLLPLVDGPRDASAD